MVRTSLAVIIILISSVVVSAQDAQLSPPAKRKFKYDGKIETTYDKIRNRSLVFFKVIPIKALEAPQETYAIQFSDERLEFTAYFGYPGQTFIAPHWVTLAFWSYTETPQRYGDNKLSIKVDGQWTELGTMKILNVTNYARRGQAPLIQQSRELPIPYQQFLRLANAKKVRVKLGTEQFDLEKEHLEAIRDLAAHTVP